MGQLSKVLRNAEGLALLFWCPGCNESHRIHHGPGSGPRWMWNGDAERPVFTPSVLVRSGHHVPSFKPGDECWCTYNAENPGDPDPWQCTVCHSFVGCNGAQPGQIIFLGDCTHALAGQTVDLPEWPNAGEPA